MSTFGVMIDRIEREIVRTDVRADVEDAIKEAIGFYENHRFWFNEGNDDKEVNMTVTNSTSYTIAARWIEVDSYTVEVASNQYQLIPRTVDWFREINTNPDTVVGTPTDYAFHNDQFWLYPTPNSAFQLRIYGLQRITALDANGNLTITSTTSGTSAWFSDGERLIRNSAKRILYEGRLDEERDMVKFAGAEARELAKLLGRSRQKIATAHVQPTAF